MIAYITPSATSVPVEKFIDTLKGNIQGFDRTQALSIFEKIGHGDKRISVSAIQQAVNSNEYPELLEGFNSYAGAYSVNGGDLTSDDFMQMLNDMFLASQELYHQAMGSMWQV